MANNFTEITAPNLSLEHIGYLVEVKSQGFSSHTVFAGLLLGYEYSSELDVYTLILSPQQDPRRITLKSSSVIKILDLKTAKNPIGHFGMV